MAVCRHFTINKFMCPRCGKETMPIARRAGRERAKNHRKWVYCPWCKESVNTYECRNDTELAAFKSRFESGEITTLYQQECIENPPKQR